MFNKVQILGTMTKDIELRDTQSGVVIGSFSIAVNDKYKSKSGEYIEKAHFFDVVAFSKTAENIANFFKKGSRMLIAGQLQQETWQNKDGQNRSKVVIKLESFEFIDRKSDNSQQTQTNKPPQYNAPQPQESSVPEIDIDSDEIPF